MPASACKAHAQTAQPLHLQSPGCHLLQASWATCTLMMPTTQPPTVSTAQMPQTDPVVPHLADVALMQRIDL